MNPQQPEHRLSLPSAEWVSRVKDLLELGLLLLAYPWILYKLFTNPKRLLENRESA